MRFADAPIEVIALFSPIRWEHDRLALLDQTRLPHQEIWLACTTPQQVAEAIQRLAVRGAPAIGVAAAYGLALGALATAGYGTALGVIRAAWEGGKQPSTIDPCCASGADIPIEERDGAEVTSVLGQPAAPAGTAALNLAFDVAPHELVTAIITEIGVLKAPYAPSIAHALQTPAVR